MGCAAKETTPHHAWGRRYLLEQALTPLGGELLGFLWDPVVLL